MNNDKIIISVATTGSWATKGHHPALPVTPEEIAAAAIASWREGAAVVHVHVREDDGAMSADLSRFQKVKGLSSNNMNILHLIFGLSLAVAQSQNPQRSAATSAVLFTRRNQI